MNPPAFLRHTTHTAACAAPDVDPDLWHSDKPAHERHAKTICASCPLLAPCQDHGLTAREAHGVWGGLTEADRRRIRRGTPTHTCGTRSALMAHRRHGETCAVCNKAEAARVAEGRRQRLAVEHARGGTVAGYHLHVRLGEAACGRCLEAWRKESERQRRKRGVGPRAVVRSVSGSGAGLRGAGAAA